MSKEAHDEKNDEDEKAYQEKMDDGQEEMKA
jgi:hypothetical protein